MTPYAELQTTSNFSFLRGASHPEELVAGAAEHGLDAIAITDRNTLAGVVRAHLAARETKIQLIVGARLDFTDAPSLLCLPMNRDAYGNLSQLITLGRRRAPKGECHLGIDDFLEQANDQIAISLATPDDTASSHLRRLSDTLPNHCYLAGQNLLTGGDQRRLDALSTLAQTAQTPLVACNDVHYHDARRRDVQDALTSVREHCIVEKAGYHLFANAERHIKSGDEMASLFRHHPDAIARTLEIAERCTFSLDELVYEYPDDEAPPDISPQDYLEQLTWAGAQERYPNGTSEKVKKQLIHELALIGELNYANYFLTVHDIVSFARRERILCQGRGSAANSAVCYCLGITAIDPARIDLLFERFISAERGEPPDIDVDFEHERREEVIQYIYHKYGRDRAGLAATVIHYRGRSAMREISRAMGLTRDVEDALAGTVSGRRSGSIDDNYVREAGLDPKEKRLGHALRLAREITGFPRHLSQHVGGFVITRGRLDAMVPIANAAMDDRTTIEWDKDDLDALGILKVDVLGLGMLTCIRKALSLLALHHGKKYELATVPAEDPAVYDMLCKADSVGVFQVESRAQMSMLPRLKPRSFYDLVIEVAIVRPGPIQGDMVHPYLRRRNGEEKIDYPSEDLRAVLEKTYGVPLFQEQAMKIAIVAAGFTPAEADGLRRAMATFRRLGTIHNYRDKMINGMIERGYDLDFAERCFKQIEGFGDYGFPESHAASFALLVYVSSWLKCHYPATFACALLNSQPMGFYAPAQIVRDARDHGVTVRPVDVNYSEWDCTLEPDRENFPALRLGFRQIKGLKPTDAEALLKARKAGNARPFSSPEDLWLRSDLQPSALERLAKADSYGSVGLSRRQALWEVRRIKPGQLPLFAETGENIIEPEVSLPIMKPGEEVSHDYAAIRLSLKHHPLELLRDRLTHEGVITNDLLAKTENGQQVTVAGLVITRQRPGTASGVIFATLEDETGIANVIIWPKLFERYRKETLASRLLCVTGELQREGIVIHLVARRLTDMSDRLWALMEAPQRFKTEVTASDESATLGESGDSGQVMYPSRDFH
ncbi:MAG: error-prone DNA polymerase [Rhodospirillaceae bacterium]|nr:error-prone DNA polymerase [Rhodospirillaceae bacterium]|tara:strand:- start:46063 stop:49248 length:3186 start_codon:yes stop_codon:yes gene_type:complete